MRLLDLYSSIRADQYIKIYEHSKEFVDKLPPKLLYKGRVRDFSQVIKSEGKDFIALLRKYIVGLGDISVEYDSYHPYIKIMVERKPMTSVYYAPTHEKSTNETKGWQLTDFSNRS